VSSRCHCRNLRRIHRQLLPSPPLRTSFCAMGELQTRLGCRHPLRETGENMYPNPEDFVTLQSYIGEGVYRVLEYSRDTGYYNVRNVDDPLPHTICKLPHSKSHTSYPNHRPIKRPGNHTCLWHPRLYRRHQLRPPKECLLLCHRPTWPLHKANAKSRRPANHTM
jgi:hypothetical protein